MEDVHQVAKDGFTDGLSYDRYRDSYSSEVVTYVANNLYKEPNSDAMYNILELGAGTGLFTRKILEVLPKETKYLATDATQNFLAVLKDKSPGLEAKLVIASNIPLPDCSVENIVCAQSFHWFSNEKGLNEIRRVLKPHGKMFILLINQQESRPWLVKFEEILSEYYAGSPPLKCRKWQEAIDNFEHFKFLEQKFFKHPPILGDKDTAVKRFLTYSAVNRLVGETRQSAVARLRAALDEEFQDGEQVVTHIEYEFYCAEKICG